MVEEKERDRERSVIRAKIFRGRPVETRGETRGSKRDVRRRESAIRVREISGTGRIIEGRKRRGERPREEFRAHRVSRRERVPGRVVCVEISKNEEVRRGVKKRWRER